MVSLVNSITHKIGNKANSTQPFPEKKAGFLKPFYEGGQHYSNNKKTKTFKEKKNYRPVYQLNMDTKSFFKD